MAQTIDVLRKRVHSYLVFYKDNRAVLADVLAKSITATLIDVLKTVVEHPNKPGYKRHDVLNKIKELEKQLQ